MLERVMLVTRTKRTNATLFVTTCNCRPGTSRPKKTIAFVFWYFVECNVERPRLFCDRILGRLIDGKKVMANERPSALRSGGNRYRARKRGGEICPSINHLFFYSTGAQTKGEFSMPETIDYKAVIEDLKARRRT